MAYIRTGTIRLQFTAIWVQSYIGLTVKNKKLIDFAKLSKLIFGRDTPI